MKHSFMCYKRQKANIWNRSDGDISKKNKASRDRQERSDIRKIEEHVVT